MTKENRLPTDQTYEHEQPNQVIQGLWQISTGHSAQIEDLELFNQLDAYRKEGLRTLDFGDIYLGVEQRVGEYVANLRQNNPDRLRDLRLHTKYVPDRGILPDHSPENVFKIIDRSRVRLQTDVLDLVQFHWWDYTIAKYREAMETLFEAQSDGLIRRVGITNFDTVRVQEFIDAGLKPDSIQLQYSILDRRPENGMTELCKENGIKIFCYGTVAGGFLSEKFFNQPEPIPPYENRSLVKYKLIIDEIGGWAKFQELLGILDQIAKQKGCDIATVASTYILQKDSVNSVIIGVRNTDHLSEHLKIKKDFLAAVEIDAIDDFLQSVPAPIGDVYTLEREDAKHSGIMHTNNNSKS